MKCQNCKQELNQDNVSSNKQLCWLCNGEKCSCCKSKEVEE